MKNSQNKLKKIKLIIFDWSGVISDDRIPVYEANMQMLESRRAKRIPFEKWLVLSRLSAYKFFIDQGINEDEVLIFEEYRKTYNSVQLTGTIPFIYLEAKNLLNFLTKKRITLALVSSHPKENLLKEIEEYGVTHCFKLVYGSSKNKTKDIQSICEQLHISLDQTIYIGDTIYDIQAAKKAGVLAGAIANGYHSKKRLLNEKPDIFLDNLLDLKKYL